MSDQVQVPCGQCDGVVRVPADRLGDAPRCPRCREPLFRATPIVIKDAAAFERHVGRNDLPAVVDFWAPWCGPCRMMAPVFERTAARLEPQARFLKVNTDEVTEVGARFGIRSIPTLMVFSRGREVARVAGAMNSQQFEQWLVQVLSAASQGQQ